MHAAQAQPTPAHFVPPSAMAQAACTYICCCASLASGAAQAAHTCYVCGIEFGTCQARGAYRQTFKLSHSAALTPSHTWHPAPLASPLCVCMCCVLCARVNAHVCKRMCLCMWVSVCMCMCVNVHVCMRTRVPAHPPGHVVLAEVHFRAHHPEAGVLEKVRPELVARVLGGQLAGGDEGAPNNLHTGDRHMCARDRRMQRKRKMVSVLGNGMD